MIAVDSQPVHFATAQNLLLADDRDVIFRLAGDDTGIATDARIQIDRHPPGVALVLVRRVEREPFPVTHMLGKAGMVTVVFERGRADQVAAFEIVMQLRVGESHASDPSCAVPGCRRTMALPRFEARRH